MLGNVIAKIDPLGQRTAYTYDSKGRLLEIRLPGGSLITCAYDPEDNLIRYQDENGAITRLEYCGQGEIKRRIQPDGQVVEYHYNTEEQLIGVTNQRGERYQLKRDALGRIVEETDYWGQKRSYDYTKAGHLKQSIDPLGQIIQFKTDPLGRILEKLLPDFNNPKEKSIEKFTYDANGNLISCENEAISIERKFDSEGRLLEESQGKDCTISNTYDQNGNRIARKTEIKLDGDTYSQVVQFKYDALDQAIGVEIPDQAPINITRNALGQIVGETLSTNLRRNFQYSPEGYLTSQQVLKSVRPLFEVQYQYDPAGNLIEKSDSRYGVNQFTYDPLGRIIKHLSPDRRVKNCLYDPAGDRLQSRVVEKVGKNNEETEWSREGQLEETAYKFNRVGNLVERKEKDRHLQLKWDANQRLVQSIKNGITTIYKYDPLGRRIAKETNWGKETKGKGQQTQFFWDGDALLGDALTDLYENKKTYLKSIRQWVYYPTTFEPLAMVHLRPVLDLVREQPIYGQIKPALFWYQNDPNGCPARMLDTMGTEVWAARYDAWGKIEYLYGALDFRVENPLRMQGQYADEETGLYYNRFRYFDPVSCAFVSQDPLGLGAGENLFRFAPNVWGWVDPLDYLVKSDSSLTRYFRIEKVDGCPFLNTF